MIDARKKSADVEICLVQEGKIKMINKPKLFQSAIKILEVEYRTPNLQMLGLMRKKAVLVLIVQVND